MVHALASVLILANFLGLGFVRGQGAGIDCGGNAKLAESQKKNERDNQTETRGTLP